MVIVIPVAFQYLIHGHRIRLMAVVCPCVRCADYHRPVPFVLPVIEIFLLPVELLEVIRLGLPCLQHGNSPSASVGGEIFKRVVFTVLQNPMTIRGVQYAGMVFLIKRPVAGYSAQVRKTARLQTEQRCLHVDCHPTAVPAVPPIHNTLYRPVQVCIPKRGKRIAQQGDGIKQMRLTCHR
ncbi:MAG: hypothetical protein BWY95_02741 [Bacteroidetes bacterium ADurb.BinA104]|nr:MAG: hypothetical protein BWY95_02741 [Bacteroidetes bacterium ADurb.BinA104]